MPYPTKQQAQTLGELWVIATHHDHGGAQVVARLLLSLYNGTRFPFDLTNLRRLDEATFEKCLDMLRMDYCPYQEVHETIGRHFYGGRHIGDEFERLAFNLRLKSCAKKASIEGLPRLEMGEFVWTEGGAA
jgi:hypothetical protein